MKKINKVIVWKSVEFYSRAWKYHNEVLYDKSKYREYIIDWYNRLIDEIQKGNKIEMKKYIRSQALDMQRCDNGYIRM